MGWLEMLLPDTLLTNFLFGILGSVELVVLTVFIIGLMAAVGPCTIATNLASIAYISQRITDRRFAIFASALYALGRITTYTVLGLLIMLIGLEVPAIQRFLQAAGSYILGPLLILGGILILLANRISFGGGGKLNSLGTRVSEWGLPGAFLMGVIFALAFCPYNAVLFFVVVIPMTLTTTGGIFLPLFFALGTAIPVILFGILIFAGVTAVSKWVQNISKYERVLRIVLAIIFLIVGIYLTLEGYIGIYY